MEATPAYSTPDFLKLLAHDVRWRLLAALAESDRRVQELVDLLQRPQNLVSYHLRLLRDKQVVRERRSSADGRDVYYSLDVDRMLGYFHALGRSLHPALVLAEPVGPQLFTSNRPVSVLFLCTQNSARSQLAEGILRARNEQAQVYSAGSEPGRVHPLAIRAAEALNIDISHQRSKHMDEFAGRNFDYVITVCDRVREVCPVFPHSPRQIHWSIPDPAAIEGSESEQVQAFLNTAEELTNRIHYWQILSAL